MMKSLKSVLVLCFAAIFGAFIALEALGARGAAGTEASAPTASASAAEIVDSGEKEERRSESISLVGEPDAQDIVTVLVGLQGEPLLETANERGVTATELLQAFDGEKLLAERNEEISRAVSSLAGYLIDVGYRYTTVFNGFSARVRYGNLAKIENSALVSKVILSNEYEAPQEIVENDVNVQDTGIFNSTNVEFDGTGTVVAVLDTGTDYTHEVFRMDLDPDTMAITKDDVARAVPALTAAMWMGEDDEEIDEDDLYITSKLPYAFDYADVDTNVYPAEAHGTHVAGIIAGESWRIRGVAPRAQIATFKVFKDSGTSSTEGILAALNDAAVLGVDAINMSLGASCGFSREEDEENVNETYDLIEQSGISLVVAAGNEFSSSYGGANGNTNLASNPDAGTVGSPATYTASFAVASISGVKTPYMYVNGEKEVYFSESRTTGKTEPNKFVEELLGNSESGEFQYVVIPGVGFEANYTNIDVNGKIAVVKRGNNSFEDKVKIAKSKGAVGVIIYNHLSGMLNMSIGTQNVIPSCLVSMDFGKYFEEKTTGTIRIDKNYLAGPFMSDFSSWGPLPDLELCPDITGHGGDITSSFPGGNEYDTISGTSMACPNIAGALVLVREYVKTLEGMTSTTEVRDLSYGLMMSTATIARNEEGNPYSPRKQGAGIGDIYRSVHTKAYLSVDGSNKPKLSLKDDPARAGVYELKFNITNMSAESLSYKINPIVMTESMSSDGKTVAEKAYMLSPTATYSVAEVTGGKAEIGNNATLSIEGYTTAKLVVTVKLSAEDKAYLTKNFVNGMYVEGYVELQSYNPDKINLNLPFLAFYGNWEDAPMLDVTAYEVGESAVDSSVLEEDKLVADVYGTLPMAGFNMTDDYGNPEIGSWGLGAYGYNIAQGYETPVTREQYASLTHNSEGNYLLYSVAAGLLRGAKRVEMEIRDSVTGELIWSGVDYNARKSHSSGGEQMGGYIYVNFDVRNYDLANNGKYTFSMTCYLDWKGEGETEYTRGNRNTFSFDFYIDDEKPVLLTNEEGEYEVYVRDANHRKTVEFNVHDNHYLQGYLVYTYESIDENGEPTGLTAITDSVVPIYNGEFNGTTRVSLDVTSYWDLIVKNNYQLYVQFMDYAKNGDEFFVKLKECDEVRLEKTRNAREQYTIRPNGDVDLEDYVRIFSKVGESEFEGYWTKKLVWTSNAPNIATVEADSGLVVGKQAGEAEISVTPADGGNMLKFKVRVEGTPTTPSVREVELSNYSLSIERGEEMTITATIKPSDYPIDDLEIQWTSSSTNVTATPDPANKLKCTVKGMKSGSATIGVRIAGTYINASCSVRVKEEYYVDSVYLRSYTGRGDENGIVKIPEDLGISYIYPLAFFQNPYIKKIIIPEGVQYIMRAGIYGCDNLEEIELPESCTQIQTFGVAWNPKLKKINTEHLQTIGAYAFVYDTSLETIDLSRTTYISAMAFVNCTALKTVDLSKVGVIGEQAFYRCTALTELVIPANTVTEFGAFYGCTSLKSVVCYGNHIGPLTFQNCTALTDVTFAGDVELIDVQAFYRCTSLTHVNFLGSVYEIGAMAFSYNTSLTSFTFPAGLTKLGQQALYGCSNLTTITVDKDACIIEPDIRAFGGLSRLNKFVVEDGNKYLAATQDGVLYDKTMYRLIAYPFARTATTFTVPESVRIIGANAFTNVSSINTIDLKNVERIEARAFQQCTATLKGTGNITYIGDYAFAANDAIAAVPTNVTYIGDYAFAGCTGLNGTLNVPAKVTHIGEYAFAESDLTTVNFTNATSLKEVDDGVFFHCTSLTSVTLGNTLEKLSTEMFAECPALGSVTIPANIKELGDSAFCRATSLATVTLQAQIDTIPDYCFGGTQILNISLPASVRTIGAHAFEGTLFATFNFNNIEEIGDSAFEGTRLGTVSAIKAKRIGTRAFYNTPVSNVTSSATEVGDLAFARCTSLTNVTLNAATTIGVSAFDGCTALGTINVKAAENIGTINVKAAENIGANAFRGTRALTTIALPAARSIGANAFSGSGVTALTLPNLRSVEQQAFAGATALGSIDVGANNSRFLTENGVLYQKNGGDLYTLVAYPLGKKDVTAYTVKERTVKVGAYAFYENDVLTKITLPAHMKSIGVGAFYRASKLATVEIGAVAAPTLESVGTMQGDDLINTYNNLPKELGSTLTLEWIVPMNATGYDGYIWKEYLGGVYDQTTNANGKIKKTKTNALNASALDFIDRVNALSELSGDERTAEINLLRRIYNLLDSTQQGFQEVKAAYAKLQAASGVSYVETQTEPLAETAEAASTGENGAVWFAVFAAIVAACGAAFLICRTHTGRREK